MTRDLRHAKVFVSIMGTDAERSATLEGLASVANASALARWSSAAVAHLLPEITFKTDESAIARAARIEDLLAQIKDAQAPADGEGGRRRLRAAASCSHRQAGRDHVARRRRRRSACDARATRVGHTGTLDPFATGLLVVLVGRATRLIPYVEGEPKVYDAVIRFGTETDTDDCTGVETVAAAAPSHMQVFEAVGQLIGPIQQVPPRYSAKQVGGTRAYDAARRGDALELAPVEVTVYEWAVNGRDGDDLSARITCGGGTYIRALARDLGRLAGSAAHLASLRRVRSGPVDVESALTLDQIADGAFELRPPLAAVPSMPVQSLDAPELPRVAHGNPVVARVAGSRVALVDDTQTLIAAVADRVGEQLCPRLVLRDA